MDAVISASTEDVANVWPALPYEEWKNTYDTLHMWTQVVGKVKLQLAPFLDQWWGVAFSVTARGLTTSTIPFDNRVFEVNFDFIDHRLSILVSDGAASAMPLSPRSVADFYAEFMTALGSLGIQVRINTKPVETENTIPLDQDQVHASYDPEYANRWWRILVQVDKVFQQYRTPFIGKSSPVQFWWGSFDLAETRFSGRSAPQREWPKGYRFNSRCADLEEAAAGFWPGNSRVPDPAFYAYTYPEPPGYRSASVRPDAALFHPELGEFFLRYEDVRRAASPAQTLMDFFESTYEAGATLGQWDRTALERNAPH